MTALKPMENRRVRGVASERYPLNKKCAHPECREDAVDPHHAFPRSAIGNDSWFVEIQEENEAGDEFSSIIPHVTGLCRAHHDAVEEHRAWIKFEDGVWSWWDRDDERRDDISVEGSVVYSVGWKLIGLLNPQPGSVEGKPKRKKFRGEKRRKRATISIKVPKDEREDGAGLLDDAVEQLEDRIAGGNAEDERDHRPIYYTLMDALNYTLLNADADDFS